MTSPSYPRQWLLLAALWLLLGSVIGWTLYSGHATADAAERARLSNLARVVDENLGQQLHATGHALESIRRELSSLKAQGDRQAPLNSRLETMADTMAGVRTILVLDSGGRVTASNRPDLLGQNFRQRAYFQAARDNRDPALLQLSPPFKTVLGAFGMNLTATVRDHRGAFAGIVTATLDPAYFDTLLESVRYAPDMWTALAHEDGMLFRMVPPRPGIEGLNLARPGSFYTRHRDSGQTATVLTGTVNATDEERLLAVRTIRVAEFLLDKQLTVAVGRDLSAIFVAWRRDAYLKSALLGVLILATSLALLRAQRRQRDYERVLADDAARLQQAETTLEQQNSELKELYQSLVTLREEERHRLARELHDDLGQRVTAIRMDLDWVEARLPPATPLLPDKMALVSVQIDDLTDSIRRITDDMRPGMLDTLGLVAALRNYVEKFSAQRGIACELTASDEEIEAQDNAGIGIFRIVQEALNNVQKHAKATRVRVDLQRSDDSITLVIEDNGIGLPETEQGGRTGLGVRGMKERIAILNGRFSITSRTGQGVRIAVVIPA